MSVSTIGKRTFAFFSADIHVEEEGRGSYRMLDPDGRGCLVNHFEGMVDGLPGRVEDGVITRPPRYETFVLKGELGGPVRGQLKRYVPPTRHSL